MRLLMRGRFGVLRNQRIEFTSRNPVTVLRWVEKHGGCVIVRDSEDLKIIEKEKANRYRSPLAS